MSILQRSVTADLITPFKHAICDNYKAVEKRIQEAVHLRFGLPAQLSDEWTKAIKRADSNAAFSRQSTSPALMNWKLAGYSPFAARATRARSYPGQPNRGCPRMIVSDNGTEFTSNAILAWQEERRIEWH